MPRKIELSASLLLCSAIALLAQNTLPSTSPIDISHYKIKLQFDWTKKQASAEVTISLAFTQAARSIQLAAHDLLIQSVHTTAKKELTFTLDTLAHRLNLSLDKNCQPGEKLDFTIAYETQHHNEPDPNAIGGSFGQGIRFFQPTQTNPIKRKQLWSQSELQNTAYWLPCSPNLADLSTTEFIATLEPGLTFVTNGTLLEKKENLEGRVTFHYQTSRAYPIYLTAFVAGNYTDLVQTVRGIPLHTFCYPDEQEAAKATTVRLPDMLQFLEDRTSFAYPYPQYAQVMVQDYPFPSLIGQNSFSIISDNMIDDYGTHQDFQNAVKKASGKDLQWFFEQWIYQTGHPVFELSNSFDAKTKLYHLQVKQIQQKDSTATYPQVNFFQGKMEIEIDGKKEVIQLNPQRDNHFTFRLPGPPKMLNFDAEQTWIKEIQWVKTREEWLQLFLHSKDMSARNAAMTELAQITKDKNTSALERSSIIQAFQQVTQSRAYWRFRFNAIGQLRFIQTPPYDQTTTEL